MRFSFRVEGGREGVVGFLGGGGKGGEGGGEGCIYEGEGLELACFSMQIMCLFFFFGKALRKFTFGHFCIGGRQSVCQSGYDMMLLNLKSR